MFFHSYPGVRARFEQTNYNVSEGDATVTICVVLDSILERDVNLTVNISDVTTTGGT